METKEGTLLEHDVRHVIGIEETSESFVVEFAKSAEVGNSDPEMTEESGHYNDEEEREIPAEIFQRSARMEMEETEDARTVRLAFSSEQPVLREYGYEILDHQRSSIDLNFINSGRAPLLLDHDARQQIGRVVSVSVDEGGRKSRALVQFSKNSELARSIFDDVKDGIRANISVGYAVNRMEMTDEKIDGRSVYRAMNWEPREISVVAIGADDSVGIGRSDSKDLQTRKESMTEETKVEVQTELPQKTETEIRNEIIANHVKIRKAGEDCKKQDFAERCIRQGMTYPQFTNALVEELRTAPVETSTPEAIGMNDKEVRSYSMFIAIRAQESGDWSGAEMEREVSKQIERNSGKSARGFFVPDCGWAPQVNKRSPYYEKALSERTIQVDTTSGGTGFGSYTVETNLLVDRFIDALISQSILGTVGATTLSGLVGDVDIPRFDANASVSFIAETGAVGNNEPDFGRVQMTPKQMANKISISRTAMMQGLNGNMEQVLRNHMVRLFAAKVDNVALKGGGSNEPTGILSTTGIGDVESGGTSGNAALTFGNVVDIITEVSQDNALLGNLHWVTHPAVVGKLMQTLVQSSTDSRMIQMTPNELMSYNLVQSTQMPSSAPYALLFGNFADLFVGFFNELDVLVDPYSSAGNASLNLFFYQFMDVGVAHPQSFAAAQDVTVA